MFEIEVPKNIPGTLNLTQGSSQRLETFLQTVNYGEQLQHSKETECSIFTLPTSTQDQYIHSSSASCCTDGGDTLPTPGTR